MLAYVFWHWRKEGIKLEEYENDLTQFHRTLNLNKSPGFTSSTVFEIDRADWLAAPSTAYEEWYLLTGSAAMDPLNYAAVHGACEEPHNRVARNAAGGTGGLYRLRCGSEGLSKARHAMWLNKPEGVSYTDFYKSLEPLVEHTGSAFWGRQMTLGPTTEFCLHSVDSIELPAGLQGKNYSLDLIWTAGS